MKTAFGLFAVAGLAAAANAGFFDVNADQRMITTISAAPLDEIAPAGTPLYSSIPGPYSAFSAAAFAFVDDYQTGGVGTFQVDAMKFVGGVTAAGGILDFFLLDNANNVVSSFGVALPQAGNFIWTITLNTPVNAAHNGRLQIQTRGATTGQWFMTSTAPSVGTNSVAFGLGSNLNPQRIAAFEIQQLVPAPSSAALLGLGGLMAARRRR
jgi:hypothetical protein